MSRFAYSSRKPLLGCEHSHLQREIGVIVEEPVFHVGMGTVTADVSYERLSLNTLECGKPERLEDVAAAVIRQTETVIEDLAAKISELVGHRLRLEEELARLRAEGLPIAIPERVREQAAQAHSPKRKPEARCSDEPAQAALFAGGAA
ncbi:MAG TPA: hypothetical protein VLT87_11135 [Thermoanaerobaculia bacterium]|nr:hypothetical protein [Thermoanaerobaculia bacterium]